MTLGKYAHLWTAIETQGSRDPAVLTASYSNQAVDIGMSRVRTQYGQSQAGRANGSGGIPENSKLPSYLPCSLSSSTRESHGMIWKHLDRLRETREQRREISRGFSNKGVSCFNSVPGLYYVVGPRGETEGGGISDDILVEMSLNRLMLPTLSGA